MRVLVIGDKGYIGQYVCEELRHRGYIPVKHDPRFENSKAFFNENGFPEKVIHCAWSGLPNYTSIDHYNNVLPHFEFLQYLVNHGVKDFTVIGSCLETLETQTHYALAKRQLRQKLEALPINLKWPQLFYVYGGNDKPYKLLPSIRMAIANKRKTFSVADCERDFIHVKEAAKAICDIALQEKVTGQIQVGTGEAIPVIDFVKRYFNDITFVKDYPIPDYEPFRIMANLQKLNGIR